MAEKAFGIPISENVHRQLVARKALMESNDKLTDQNMLLNNRGSFVRVVSSVNSKDLPSDSEFTSDLASSFILHGGTLTKQENEDGKTEFKMREGFILNDVDDVGAYHFDDQIGYRPMAGINSFTVQSMGTYGTLKKAEIGFSVWSLQQLDAVEKLFFRPGFNILVEYGNSSYIDTTEVKAFENYNIDTYQTSLAEVYLNGSKTLPELQKMIVEKQEETSYNYSGFLGRIINFSWSYNKSGGFDCTVSIQAKGEIVESLGILMSNNKNSKLNEFFEDNDAKSDNSTLLEVLKVLKKKGENYKFMFNNLRGKDLQPLPEDQYFVTNSFGFNIAGLDKGVVQGEDAKKYQVGRGFENRFRFINLGLLMAVCNELLMPRNEKNILESYLRTGRYKSSKLSSTFITFPGHVALNPGICMLPFKSGDGVYYSDLEMYGGTLPWEVEETKSIAHAEPENVYSIMVNLDHLISIVEAFAKSKADNVESSDNVFTFIKKVLGDINTNLGGINKLDLDLDKVNNEWRVVDRNYYDPETVAEGDKYVTLDLVGLGSLVTEFKLDSKISGEMTKMIAISAAVSGNDVGSSGINKYNEGVKDRFKKTLTTGPTETEPSDDLASDQEKANQEALDYGAKVQAAYTLYCSKTKKWDREAFRNNASNHRMYTEACYKHNQRTKRQSGQKAPFKGIIPLSLSLTMDGISGLKVGEAFKIQNNILPTRYHNNVGFIITGLTDNVDTSGRWETEISTRMFMLPSTEEPDPGFLAAQEKIAKQKEEARKKAEVNTAERQKAVVETYGEPGDTSKHATVAVPDGFNLQYEGKKVFNIKGVHQDVADGLHTALTEIKDEYGSDKIKRLGINVYAGVYNKRPKRGGTTFSLHSWGIAIDLLPNLNKLNQRAPDANFSRKEYERMVEIFENNGWYSLGKSQNYDWMHFQAWNPDENEYDRKNKKVKTITQDGGVTYLKGTLKKEGAPFGFKYNMDGTKVK